MSKIDEIKLNTENNNYFDDYLLKNGFSKDDIDMYFSYCKFKGIKPDSILFSMLVKDQYGLICFTKTCIKVIKWEKGSWDTSNKNVEKYDMDYSSICSFIYKFKNFDNKIEGAFLFKDGDKFKFTSIVPNNRYSMEEIADFLKKKIYILKCNNDRI